MRGAVFHCREGEEVTETTRAEEFKIDGKRLRETLQDLLHQGNIRRVTVRNNKGKTFLDIPLTVGVVGAALVPAAAAIGAVAALAAELTIAVEKVESPTQ
jgi:hypothetical protein